jgi:hypothetical protein
MKLLEQRRLEAEDYAQEMNRERLDSLEVRDRADNLDETQALTGCVNKTHKDWMEAISELERLMELEDASWQRNMKTEVLEKTRRNKLIAGLVLCLIACVVLYRAVSN